jgi:hypothetical protein
VWHVEQVTETSRPSGHATLRYGPPRATVPALVVLALAIGAYAAGAGTSERYAGAAAAVILLLAAGWAARGPAVVADPDGVTIRSLFGRRRISWTDVIRLRTDDRRRSHSLEFEVVGGLVVVPSYLLGRTPLAVAARELSALREKAADRSP